VPIDEIFIEKGEVMKKKTVAMAALVALSLASCEAIDRDRDRRDDRQEARRGCMELARDRGYRNLDVESIEREGRDEWRVVMRGRREGGGGEQTVRCLYNDRANRGRLAEAR
jgi:hypothetical protein